MNKKNLEKAVRQAVSIIEDLDSSHNLSYQYKLTPLGKKLNERVEEFLFLYGEGEDEDEEE